MFHLGGGGGERAEMAWLKVMFSMVLRTFTALMKEGQVRKGAGCLSCELQRRAMSGLRLRSISLVFGLIFNYACRGWWEGRGRGVGWWAAWYGSNSLFPFLTICII